MSEIKRETADHLLTAIQSLIPVANAAEIERLANAYKAVTEAYPKRSAYDN